MPRGDNEKHDYSTILVGHAMAGLGHGLPLLWTDASDYCAPKGDL
jgi:hypothetical protein